MYFVVYDRCLVAFWSSRYRHTMRFAVAITPIDYKVSVFCCIWKWNIAVCTVVQQKKLRSFRGNLSVNIFLCC